MLSSIWHFYCNPDRKGEGPFVWAATIVPTSSPQTMTQTLNSIPQSDPNSFEGRFVIQSPKKNPSVLDLINEKTENGYEPLFSLRVNCETEDEYTNFTDTNYASRLALLTLFSQEYCHRVKTQGSIQPVGKVWLDVLDHVSKGLNGLTKSGLQNEFDTQVIQSALLSFTATYYKLSAPKILVPDFVFKPIPGAPCPIW